MNKVFRWLAMCAIAVAFATLSIAWAQRYTKVDFPGATATLLIGGPNPRGTSVGIEITAGFQHGFVLTAAGVFTVIDPPGSTLTSPNYIDAEDVIVGNFLNASHVTHGFILYRGHYTTFDVPGALATALSGVIPSGEMTGFTCLADPTCETPPYESFTVSRRGEITSFNPFGAPSSFASGLNPSGTVVGTYTGSGGVNHGYQFCHGTFTSNDFPGSILTFNGGINPQGEIVGFYTDTSNVTHSFLLSDGTYTGFDPPGASYSNAGGINSSGIIVGFYLDSANVAHGYIRTPRR
ncbi:MAG: hypothetical protein ACLPND_19630 [Candidatus Korobacteraceae bacterium]